MAALAGASDAERADALEVGSMCLFQLRAGNVMRVVVRGFQLNRNASRPRCLTPQREIERLRNALLHLESSNEQLRQAIVEEGPDKARLQPCHTRHIVFPALLFVDS